MVGGVVGEGAVVGLVEVVVVVVGDRGSGSGRSSGRR